MRKTKTSREKAAGAKNFFDRIRPLPEAVFPLALAINSKDRDVAFGALKKMRDQLQLAAVACNAEYGDVAMAACEKISDTAALIIVYLDSRHSDVQAAAQNRLRAGLEG